MRNLWHDWPISKKMKPAARLYFIFGFILAVFIAIRVFRLPSTLFFFNDMGRDLLVLWQAWAAKKPFLLGPQNSALPFNQPALYFYSLFPAFLLSGMSLYTHTITFWLITGTILLGVSRWLWSWRSAFIVFLCTLWLMALQPECIIQNRFIWNPSFVAPLVLLAFLAYWKTRVKTNGKAPQWKWIWLWAFALATAFAFSYSVAPLLLAFVVIILWQWRWQAWRFAVALITTSVVWQLPTIAFELRYHWQLTRAVLAGNRPEQVAVSVGEKLSALQNFFWHLPSSQWSLVASCGVIAILVANMFVIRQTSAQDRDQSFLLAGTLSLLTILFTLLIPVGVQSHYVFGLFTLLLLTLASLRGKMLISVIGLCSVIWLWPVVRGQYWQKPWRTMADLESCGQLVCSQVKQPVFVSTQSSFHPFHNGPEWRFIFAKKGCQVKAIETENGQAQTMLVVADNGEYQHGKTSYNELSLFDAQKARVASIMTCQPNVKVYVVER